MPKMKPKPKLFVGCSSEALPIGYAIQDQLESHADVVLWNQGVFALSGNTLDDLLRQLDGVDFGLFILSPDDLTRIRGNNLTSARDNVILELGLFLGRLGRARTFFLTPRDITDFRIPSDLFGVHPATFDSTRLDDNVRACLGPACNKVREAMQRTINTRNQSSRAALVRAELHRLILNCFKLYKDTLVTLRGDLSRLRVHFLKYSPPANELQMLIQDDIYEDRSFRVQISEGVKQQVVVCEAANGKRLIARNLPQEHSSHYPESQIPYSLRSVIAYPVTYKRGGIAGVVALDSELSLEEFGIDRAKLSATFLKLCNLVEDLIADHEDQIQEV
jgi:hypothetical protein